MPRHHTPDRKAAAMQLLERNGGDVYLTHLQTGIPQRTLYSWRTELIVLRRHTPSPPPPQSTLPDFDDVIDALIYLRNNILEVLQQVVAATSDNLMPYLYWDHIRAQVRLLDCVLKLDKFLAPEYHQRALQNALPVRAIFDDDDEYQSASEDDLLAES